MGEYQVKLVVEKQHNSENLSGIKFYACPLFGKFGGIESFCLTLCEDILARGAMVTLLRKKVKGFVAMDPSNKMNEILISWTPQERENFSSQYVARDKKFKRL